MPSPPARPGSGSSSTATTSRTPTSGPPSPQRPACWSSTMSRSSTRSSGSRPRPGESSRSCSASRRASRPRRTPRSGRPTRRRSSGSPPPTSRRAAERAAACPHLRLDGLHVHLGSQIRDLDTYLQAVEWLAAVPGQRRAARCSTSAAASRSPTPTTTTPPICAPPSAATVAAVAERFDPLPELVLEPGRSVVGTCGVTLYTVGAVKETAGGVTYVAVDGGMSDNPRPVLYGARYQAWIADRAGDGARRRLRGRRKALRVGRRPDRARRGCPAPRPGDVLAVAATGAYSASMASNYNGLPRPAAVVVPRRRRADGRPPRDGGRPPGHPNRLKFDGRAADM